MAPIKRMLIFFLCVCLFVSAFPLTAFATNATTPDVEEQTNSIGELNGYLAGNIKAVNQFYTDRKFTAVQGHGFAAERGNNLIDTLKGQNAAVVGDNNMKDGADRRIINRDGSITWIQDKYYSTASGSVNAAFDDSSGLYRYLDADGAPMKLEVPSDQYDDAVNLMKEKIKNGKVPNVTDPEEAVNIIKKGGLSYKQAVNLTKAGTIESLTYDAVNGTITATCAAGISFAIDYTCCVINGIEPEAALKSAGMNGLKTGGVVFATYVISSQLVKTGLPHALAPTAEAIAKSLGPDVCGAILLRSGATAAGKDVIKSASQIIAKELIADGVLIVVLTGVDVVELFRGRISKEELLKNLTVTIISVAAGAAGGYGGAALGSLIAPGAGTVIGGIIGSFLAGTLSSLAAEALIAPFYESDAEEMFNIISSEFLVLCEEHLINENEGAAITDKLKSKLVGDVLKDMYASDNRNKFARDLMEPLFIEQANNRAVIKMPSAAELRSEMKDALHGIVFVH